MEVVADRRKPLGMPPARFLRDYWQKRPLLIRGAFPQFHNVISADDLAGLACEEGSLARLVIHDVRRDRWNLRNGPFSAGAFKRLPSANWTLLVQDVDKWDAQVAALLDQFAFLPAWRIDDVMVSYAVDGGGVGTHVDHYDVFLVQTHGRRHWRISIDPTAPKAFREDVELKLLRRFEPTHEWTLDPGDALYLPPDVPHDGIAIGACMTCSVGMRAPSVAELIVDFAESIAEPLGESHRFVDPDLTPARDSHRIDSGAIARAVRALAGLRDPDQDALRSWFGGFITRYRSTHSAASAPVPITRQQLIARLGRGRLVRNPWSRTAWSASGTRAELFVAGNPHRCSRAIAQLLAEARKIGRAHV